MSHAPAPPCLLLGESGTGKEVFARYIHGLSPRSTGPWIAVNCAALPGELLESELFGHEKGSFTGAADRRIGRIEQADHGTLLLDEISEMPIVLQVKLLRVLQEREVDRVGGARPIPVDVRIIATSNRDLATMVARGEFRADLYYRLSVFPIFLPPLRERREDIPALAARLTEEIALRLGRPAPMLSAEALAELLAYEFPGNVRELANVLERVLVRCHGTAVPAQHVAVALAAVGISSIRPLPGEAPGRRPARQVASTTIEYQGGYRRPRTSSIGRLHAGWLPAGLGRARAHGHPRGASPRARQPHPRRAPAWHQPAHPAQQAAGAPPFRRSHARWATLAGRASRRKCPSAHAWHGNRMKSQQHESL